MMHVFEHVSPSQLILASALTALVFSLEMDAEALNVSGNFIVAVGGIILAVAALKDYLASLHSNDQALQACQEEILKLQQKAKQLCYKC